MRVTPFHRFCSGSVLNRAAAHLAGSGGAAVPWF
jgi:hypothetical protein